MMQKNYYLGLDIGTNSVGMAAADEEYNLIKYKGDPVWCSHLFDDANQCDERRLHRTARRRLQRRKQRVQLIDEIFATEVSKVDEKFYIRKKESALWKEDKTDRDTPYMFFGDKGYTDQDFYKEYPTIHHLIAALMESEGPFDVRLVNIAVDWLVAHRGHFLSDISVENVDKITDFQTVYRGLLDYFAITGCEDQYIEWAQADQLELEHVMKAKMGITARKKALKDIIYGGKIPKNEEVLYKYDSLINFLAGGKIKAKDLFQQSEYEADFSFAISDDMDEILPQLGDDAELTARLVSIYEWSLLSDILGTEKYISNAKVRVYEQHKADLAGLKKFVRKYCPKKYYLVFKDSGKDLNNYTAYSGNYKSLNPKEELPKKVIGVKDFTDFLRKTLMLEKLDVEDCDMEFYEDMMRRIENGQFMPKQINSDNRVIPHQLYEVELKKILDKAQNYLPFLKTCDKDGNGVSDKIMSVFRFRIPYYVGPLRKDNSENAWIIRKKDDKIYPWNFDDVVDKDASEEEFIKRMTNECTYLPGKTVLPKWSLVYSRFMVLNEINNIKVNAMPISVEAKQALYLELFEKKAKVTVKMIRDFLLSNKYMEKDDLLSGIDTTIKSSLKGQYEFRRLLQQKILSTEEVERIIERSTYTEDKSRFRRWIRETYPQLSEEDAKYVGKLKFKDFGRMSKEFLVEMQGTDQNTGEVGNILYFMWNTNDNLMQLLSKRYTFMEQIQQAKKEYYQGKQMSVTQQLEDMGISNAVKRPVIRTLDVVHDVVSTLGYAPKKIFVEMARGADPDQKGRTKPRKQQLLELYKNVTEDTQILEKELEDMGDMANNRLQSEALFLYYLQLGKCAYSGESIDLSLLKSGKYNVDHIYPQCYVKDDSVLNNKVLVLSELNAQKGDVIPIKQEIRTNQRALWDKLYKYNLMTSEKYRRLTRNTPFSESEKEGFINRQLVETRQSMKAVTQLLNQLYPDTEVVYVKAKLASDFRKEFLTPKSRLINDLHHAKDAYLNIVVGNVYNEKFTAKWFNTEQRYSMKTKVLFTRSLVHGDTVIWDPDQHLPRVKSIYKKNNVKMTRYSYCQKGGLYDQMPVRAGDDLVPLKKGLDPKKYGGYNKSSAAFFMLASYDRGGKKDVSLVPIELMVADRFLQDEEFASRYVQEQLQKLNKKTISDIEFPLGMRVIKYKTVLSLDGYEVWVNGKSGGGKQILISSAMSLIVSKEDEQYIKKLENFSNKRSAKLNIHLDGEHDGINAESNEKLYDYLMNKMKNVTFSKMPGCQSQTLIDGQETFLKLELEEQVTVLLTIVELLAAGRAGGRDLHMVGGKSKSGTMNLGAALSSSSYKDIRIIDYSPAGLHKKVSVNLKNFLE